MRFLLLTLLILGLFSCTKDNDTSNNTNSPPSISITEPDENFTVYLGASFSLEGLAVDKEGLKSVHYEITTPDATYNYTTSNSLNISGLNKEFNKEIYIPEAASIGNAILNVWAFDTDNNQSEIIKRNFTIFDNYHPKHYVQANHINPYDSISFSFFRNVNNFVDSIVIMNHTTSNTLLTVKDKGGLKNIYCEMSGASNHYDTLFNLTVPTPSLYIYQAGAAGEVEIDLINFNQNPLLLVPFLLSKVYLYVD